MLMNGNKRPKADVRQHPLISQINIVLPASTCQHSIKPRPYFRLFILRGYIFAPNLCSSMQSFAPYCALYRSSSPPLSVNRKMAISKLIDLVRFSILAGIVVISALTTSSYAEDVVPPGITRFGLTTVGQYDYYISMPPFYPIESAEKKIGPDKKWMKIVWFPIGQDSSNWSEMMSFLILPGNVPPIDLMSTRLMKSCPDSFTKLSAAAPQFVVEYESADAAQMSCGPDAISPLSVRGYYVAVRTKDYSYLLSREIRSGGSQKNESLPSETLEEWRRGFEKFTVCAKGDLCVKLKTKDK